MSYSDTSKYTQEKIAIKMYADCISRSKVKRRSRVE